MGAWAPGRERLNLGRMPPRAPEAGEAKKRVRGRGPLARKVEGRADRPSTFRASDPRGSGGRGDWPRANGPRRTAPRLSQSCPWGRGADVPLAPPLRGQETGEENLRGACPKKDNVVPPQERRRERTLNPKSFRFGWSGWARGTDVGARAPRYCLSKGGCARSETP